MDRRSRLRRYTHLIIRRGTLSLCGLVTRYWWPNIILLEVAGVLAIDGALGFFRADSLTGLTTDTFVRVNISKSCFSDWREKRVHSRTTILRMQRNVRCWRWRFVSRTPEMSSLALCNGSLVSYTSGDARKGALGRDPRTVERDCGTVTVINVL